MSHNSSDDQAIIRLLKSKVEELTKEISRLREAIMVVASYVPNCNYVLKRIHNMWKIHNEQK